MASEFCIGGCKGLPVLAMGGKDGLDEEEIGHLLGVVICGWVS